MTFEDFVARKDAARAAEVRVTWRRVSDLTGGGWSGLGPDGALVWVRAHADGAGFVYGDYAKPPLDTRIRVSRGSAPTVGQAKERAAALLGKESAA